MQSGVILLQPGPRGFRIGSIVVGELVCCDGCRAAGEQAQAGVWEHGVTGYADFELQGL
jgi:hypothetical protein